jgi:hypothetical protein
VSLDAEILILKVAAEGGSISLVVDRESHDRFRVRVSDQAPVLAQTCSGWLDWNDATAFLDRYPWPSLKPLEISPAHRATIWSLIESRMGLAGRRAEDWRELCFAGSLETAPRYCLLPPGPENELAARLLGEAADALLRNEVELAARLIRQADLEPIRARAIRMVGRMSLEVHRTKHRPATRPKSERAPGRMPSAAKQRAVFERDGWHCRFCGTPVISRDARRILARRFPAEANCSGKEFARHAALYAMAASLDHVEPHSRGGLHEDTKFVTACYCCQFGRGELLLAEAGLTDPRDRPPRVDAWDGLTRLLVIRKGIHEVAAEDASR